MRRGLCTLYDQSPSALCLGNPVARDLHVVIGRTLAGSTRAVQSCLCSLSHTNVARGLSADVAVSNLGQPLFCLSITWSRCRNAYRDLWIMTIRCRPWSTLDELVRIVILHEAEQMWSLLKYRSTIYSSPWITDNGQDICSHQIRLLHVELLENIQLPSEYIETDEQMVDGWTDWTRSVMKMTLP